MSSFINDDNYDSGYDDYSEDNDDIIESNNYMKESDTDIREPDTDIREPDKPKTQKLIESSSDFLSNINTNNYNEEMYLKQALEESLKEAEDEYISLQLEQMQEEDQLIDSTQNESDMEEILKLSLLESKKEERSKSLANIIYQIQKLKRIDANFSIYFIELENILYKYINCEIDNYDISSEIYKNIFEELKQIRVKDIELNIIKDILTIFLN
jgi:hypothetical protein